MILDFINSVVDNGFAIAFFCFIVVVVGSLLITLVSKNNKLLELYRGLKYLHKAFAFIYSLSLFYLACYLPIATLWVVINIIVEVGRGILH